MSFPIVYKLKNPINVNVADDYKSEMIINEITINEPQMIHYISTINSLNGIYQDIIESKEIKQLTDDIIKNKDTSEYSMNIYNLLLYKNKSNAELYKIAEQTIVDMITFHKEGYKSLTTGKNTNNNDKIIQIQAEDLYKLHYADFIEIINLFFFHLFGRKLYN